MPCSGWMVQEHGVGSEHPACPDPHGLPSCSAHHLWNLAPQPTLGKGGRADQLPILPPCLIVPQHGSFMGPPASPGGGGSGRGSPGRIRAPRAVPAAKQGGGVDQDTSQSSRRAPQSQEASRRAPPLWARLWGPLEAGQSPGPRLRGAMSPAQDGGGAPRDRGRGVGTSPLSGSKLEHRYRSQSPSLDPVNF